MKKMKKIATLLPALIIVLAIASCGHKNEQQPIHKIGVIVYDLKDEQIQAFRQYMEGYLGKNFSDVDFLYSAGITTEEEEMEFLKDAIEEGVEGIIAFNSFDLEKEVELCASGGVYYLRPSSTTDPEDFDKVADNPYFLGYFGPGNEMEYQAGYDMAAYFAEEKISDSYFILSGGAGSNVMHEQRTEGMLDALQKAYGVQFDQSSTELASASEPVSMEAGALKVTVFPGYIGVTDVGEKAVAAFEKDPAGVVMSTIPVQTIADSLKDASLGTIDCYTQANGRLFKNGNLKYLCGKYESIIGPAFAAMYNAVTGYSEDFREDGKAFTIQQGFWVSTSYQDFQKKYELSSGITLNAYSYEDLLEVCKAHNSNATLDDLKKLAGAWDFDSAVQRRK